MRSDQKGFQLNSDVLAGVGGVVPDFVGSRFGNLGKSSQSGHETNHLFLSLHGEEPQFVDVSGVSGTNSSADGRGFAVWDFDRDGWQDLAVVNANAPLLEVFRSNLGRMAGAREASGGVIALRLHGGNRTETRSEEWSNRDGIGARIMVELGERRILRELRCGEGLAAQSSATLLVGVGGTQSIPSVSVRWPSGRVQTLTDVPEGSLLDVYEDARFSPDGEAFVTSAYRRPTPVIARASGEAPIYSPFTAEPNEPSVVALRVMTTMATWCGSCKAELPELERLRERFGTAVAWYGLPADLDEGRDELAAWRDDHRPAYELLLDISAESIAAAKRLLAESLGGDAMPGTIVTDAEGRVLLTRFGAPRVSELRRLAAQVSRQ